MKQSKRLTRAHYSLCSKFKVPTEVVSELRYYRNLSGEEHFVYQGKIVRLVKGGIEEVK